MVQTLLIILGAFVLYKLIFDFIIPVYRTSRDIRRQFRNINQQMQDKMNQFNQANQNRQRASAEVPPQEKKKPAADTDYIDFEEVK